MKITNKPSPEDISKDLIHFIAKSPSPYHTVRSMKAALTYSKFTELREEAGNGLRRVVGADHQVAGAASNRVLGDHAGARLHITLVEVAHLLAGRGSVGGVETVHGFGNVEGQGAGGLDET